MKSKPAFPWDAAIALAAFMLLLLIAQVCLGFGLGMMNKSSWLSVFAGLIFCGITLLAVLWVAFVYVVPAVAEGIRAIKLRWRGKKDDPQPRRSIFDPLDH